MINIIYKNVLDPIKNAQLCIKKKINLIINQQEQIAL